METELKTILTKVLDLLEQQLGQTCEIVLHDLKGDYAHTIVDIRNGYITGRKVGGCGSNLGLEVIHGTVQNGDKFNYISHTPSGKTLRSSSIYFHDADGTVTGSLCINQDITDTVKFEGYLREFNQYRLVEEPGREVFAQNVNELLEHFIQEATKLIGKEPKEMNRMEKMQMIKYLDDKGAFLITKSGEHVCETMGISRFTLYNYLDLLRKGKGKTAQGGLA